MSESFENIQQTELSRLAGEKNVIKADALSGLHKLEKNAVGKQFNSWIKPYVIRVSPHIKLMLVTVSLLVGLVLSLHFHTELSKEGKLLASIQHHNAQINQADSLVVTNQLYLQQTKLQGMDDLIKLLEMVAILDVMKSSQIGVSFIADFNVTVGQVLAELNRSIKIAIEVNLASVAAVEIIGLVAQVSHLLAPFLLPVVLVLWLVFFVFWFTRQRKLVPQHVALVTRLLAKRATLIFVTFHLLLPYSIHFSAHISQVINAQTQQHNSQRLSNIHSVITALPNDHELKNRAKSSIHHLSSVSAKQMHKKTENLFAYLIWRLVLTLFDVVLMPAAILYALYRSVRAGWQFDGRTIVKHFV